MRNSFQKLMLGTTGSKKDVSLAAALKSKFEILRDHMVRKRHIVFPIIKRRTDFSFSDLCGHCGFLCLGISYLATDIASLRMSAIGGISFHLLFQYYRLQPLWIPIGWNSGSLFINLYLLGSLLKESNDADNLPEEQKQLFTSLFKDVGEMKMEDMLHLMMIANREEFKPGTKFLSVGKRRNHLYLIVRGKCKVMNKNGEYVGEIGPNQFISEQSFTTFKTKLAKKQHDKTMAEMYADVMDAVGANQLIQLNNNKEVEEKKESNSINDQLEGIVSEDSLMETTVTTTTTSATTTTNNEEDGIVNTIGSIFNHAMDTVTNWVLPTSASSGAVVTLTQLVHTTNSNNNHATVHDTSTSHSLSDTVEEEDRYSHSFDKDDIPPSEWLLGKADVIATEPIIVYTWSFNRLNDMIIKRPSIGVVYERLISADLNRKMLANTSTSAIRNYRQMLSGVLMDENDHITNKKRYYLEKYRLEHGITKEDHGKALKEMNWTEEEYAQGKKGMFDQRIVHYKTMVQQLLKGKEEVLLIKCVDM